MIVTWGQSKVIPWRPRVGIKTVILSGKENYCLEGNGNNLEFTQKWIRYPASEVKEDGMPMKY